jgi:hypothetical protein
MEERESCGMLEACGSLAGALPHARFFFGSLDRDLHEICTVGIVCEQTNSSYILRQACSICISSGRINTQCVLYLTVQFHM